MSTATQEKMAFRVFTTVGNERVMAANAEEARKIVRKRRPEALITKVKQIKGEE